MSHRPRAALAALAASLLSLALAGPALAVTGGTDDGGGHPNVGMMYFTQPDGNYRCSGTLISPTVFLTAAHCTQGSTNVLVTFDNPGPRYPTTPAALTRFIPGVATANPLYTGKLQNTKLGDDGVVVLALPATSTWPGVTPAALPTAGLLDVLAAKGALKKTPFTIVGYGVFFDKPIDGPQKAQTVSDRIRRVTTAPLQNLTSDVIKLQENEKNSTLGGGSCYGDSGGPLFLGNLLVGVTSFGSTMCIGMGGYQRLDTTATRAFLSSFVTLP